MGKAIEYEDWADDEVEFSRIGVFIFYVSVFMLHCCFLLLFYRI